MPQSNVIATYSGAVSRITGTDASQDNIGPTASVLRLALKHRRVVLEIGSVKAEYFKR